MPVQQTLATVVANDELILNHKVLVCEAPEIARDARPGHFVNVLASDWYGSVLRKPFSIYQADPKAGQIAMLYQITGATTQGMSRKVPGDQLDLVGPLGGRVFVPDTRKDVDHVMVGGGYGVPPLVFLASELRSEDAHAKIAFIIGARRKDLLVCEGDLDALNVTAYMATEDGSHGHRGRVTDVLKNLLQSNTTVYCCGPTPMMKAVGELCGKAGVPCQVSLEVPMPCGVGVCMGCVIDMTDGRRLRACLDGPVFDPSEVVWR
ncbi:MAG TPA: dihydroorotate dehydrogenase electron transfer subunit [Capsulimonadaceae bacterium]|nr:dihydroorotate dehydrogenase electron transfer subunit [Capsulimonadaceae bacterium]